MTDARLENGTRLLLAPGYLDKLKTALIKGRGLCDHEHAGPSTCHPDRSQHDRCPWPEDCWYGKLDASVDNIRQLLNGTNWLFDFTPPCRNESFLHLASLYLRPDGWPKKVVWTHIDEARLDEELAKIQESPKITPWFMQGFENAERLPITRVDEAFEELQCALTDVNVCLVQFAEHLKKIAALDIWDDFFADGKATPERVFDELVRRCGMRWPDGFMKATVENFHE